MRYREWRALLLLCAACLWSTTALSACGDANDEPDDGGNFRFDGFAIQVH